jgi:two-component system response regulator MprA
LLGDPSRPLSTTQPFQGAFSRRVQTVGVRILVVDDDPGVRTAVGRALAFEGYDVDDAADGAAALDFVHTKEPDAIVLDVGMPRLDGLEVCRRLRAEGATLPILVLTARHQVTDRVAGLDAGADDYLVKPFALEELLARLRALLRRVGQDDTEVLRLDDLTLDPATRHVERDGTPISLTRTEFNLLELLLLNADHVLTRDVIFERVWGYDFDVSSNSLDVYIGYLRRKTEVDGRPRLIHTVRGVGYVARVQ